MMRLRLSFLHQSYPKSHFLMHHTLIINGLLKSCIAKMHVESTTSFSLLNVALVVSDQTKAFSLLNDVKGAAILPQSLTKFLWYPGRP